VVAAQWEQMKMYLAGRINGISTLDSRYIQKLERRRRNVKFVEFDCEFHPHINATL